MAYYGVGDFFCFRRCFLSASSSHCLPGRGSPPVNSGWRSSQPPRAALAPAPATAPCAPTRGSLRPQLLRLPGKLPLLFVFFFPFFFPLPSRPRVLLPRAPGQQRAPLPALGLFLKGASCPDSLNSGHSLNGEGETPEHQAGASHKNPNPFFFPLPAAAPRRGGADRQPAPARGPSRPGPRSPGCSWHGSLWATICSFFFIYFFFFSQLG